MKELVTREVADLIPYGRNSRTHSEAQIAQIVASIKEFGFINPILIDEQNTVIAGYGRLLAAHKLKMREVQCIALTGLTQAQKTAYAIADNKLALNAGWNDEMLCAELARLVELEYDTNLTGFSEVEIATLLEALDSVPTDIDLPGTNLTGTAPTGVDPTDTDAMDASATDPASEWQGMPEFEQPEAGPFRTLRVHFKDQAAVDAFANLIAQKLTDKTKYVWYPEVAKVAATQVYA